MRKKVGIRGSRLAMCVVDVSEWVRCKSIVSFTSTINITVASHGGVGGHKVIPHLTITTIKGRTDGDGSGGVDGDRKH